MFSIATKMGGMCSATPDVCLVPAPPAPPIPTPFPNIAQLPQANPGTCAQKVKILNQPVVHKGTMIPMSSGDEAGSAGGVMSGMIKGPCTFKTASMKVKVEGQAVVHQTCLAGQNGTNANMPAGQVVAPSQPKVKVSM